MLITYAQYKVSPLSINSALKILRAKIKFQTGKTCNFDEYFPSLLINLSFSCAVKKDAK